MISSPTSVIYCCLLSWFVAKYGNCVQVTNDNFANHSLFAENNDVRIRRSEKFERLPEVAKPISYHLQITLSLEKIKQNIKITELENEKRENERKGTEKTKGENEKEIKPDKSFEGDVTIEVEVTSAVKYLELHAKSLKIISISVRDTNKNRNKLLNVKDWKLDDDKEILKINFTKSVELNSRIQLHIIYTGELYSDMNGLYLTNYEHEGKTHMVALTQFESTYARMAFPCWDEPVYKSVFYITLIVDKDYTALSNMNVASARLTQDRKQNKFTFAKTPMMSTYIVAFVVGEFMNVQNLYTPKGQLTQIPVSVYAPLGKVDQANYVAKFIPKVLKYYEDFFDDVNPENKKLLSLFPQVISKVDMVAVPNFRLYGMENWGLITSSYRLLISPESSQRLKVDAAITVCHEISHFWFGNLVTMKWWDDVWLKEGVATLLQYICVSSLMNELKTELGNNTFDVWQLFLFEERYHAMEKDQQRGTSVPIIQEINNPNEIDDKFGTITYAKGPCVLRILKDFIGTEIFKKGLRSYLIEFAKSGKNTESADFMRHMRRLITDPTKNDVESILEKWTKEPGLPVIYVAENVNRPGEFTLTQSRFYIDGEGETDESNLIPWKIPIDYLAEQSGVQQTLLSGHKGSLSVQIPAGAWILLNYNAVGFYRVHYSSVLRDRLLNSAFNSKKLTKEGRYVIVNDIFCLAKAHSSASSPPTDKVSFVDFLKLIPALQNENEYLVLKPLIDGIHSLVTDFAHETDIIGPLRTFAAGHLGKILNKIGLEPKGKEDDYFRAQLRQILISELVHLGHTGTIEKAVNYSSRGVDKINSEIRESIFRAISIASIEGVEKLRKIYMTSESNEVKTDALAAIVNVQDENILWEILEAGISNGTKNSHLKNMRPTSGQWNGFVIDTEHYKDYVFHSAIGSPMGEKVIWEFFKKHVKELITQFGGVDKRYFQVCFQYATAYDKKEFEEFFTQNFTQSQQVTLEKKKVEALDKIEQRDKVLAEKNKKELRSYLNSPEVKTSLEQLLQTEQPQPNQSVPKAKRHGQPAQGPQKRGKLI